MIYSKTCEYAIRALLFLASRPKGVYMLTKVVSLETGVPAAYLAKIFRDLTRHKILRSKRGARGGVALALDPKAITLKRVVGIIDDPAHLKNCVMGLDHCSDQNACPLHAVWAEARAKMMVEMQNCTLFAITKKVGAARYREMKRGRLNLDLSLSRAGN